MKLASRMATWIHPTLPLAPFQWVRKLNGEQIFDSFRLFQLFQNNPGDDFNRQMAFLFHLLGCHGDLHNCKKRPSILALKFNSLDGVIIGMIAYPRLSVHLVLLSVEQTKDMFKAMESYFQLLPSYRQTLTHETITNGTKGRTRSLIPAIIGCPSNLHPHSAFQGIVHSVLLLTNHFHLNFVQIASVLTAWDFCAECSYYFLAATVFAIGHFTLAQCEGIGIGHNLLKLIRSIYKYEDKPECANIQQQFNRYTKNYTTCFHVKSTFEHMVYVRIFLGQWCFVYHPLEPKKNGTKNSLHCSSEYIYQAGKEDVCTVWRPRPSFMVIVRVCPIMATYLSNIA